jgi:hypothetical protein
VEDTELVQLKIAVRSLLDDVNKRYPDKNPREWTCKHMQLLDNLMQEDVVQERLPTTDENSVNEQTIRVSFTFDVEGELDEELEFLHAKAKYSSIKKLVEDHIREKIKDPVNNPDFLKNMKVNFSIPHSRTREQIISSMCFTYRHDYGLAKSPGVSGMISSGMTEEQRKSLYNQMAQIFDNDIAPYVDLKCFSKTNESSLSVNQLQHLSKTSHPPEGFSADTEW